MDINQIIQSSHTPAASTLETASLLYGGGRPGNTNATGGTDSVELSQEGVFLNELEQGGIEWGKTFKTVPPIPRSFDELAQWIDEYNTAVQERIQELFAQEGVPQQEDVRLQLQADGRITVSGTTEQAQALEEVANRNPAIQQLMQSASQRSDLFDILGHGNELRLADNANERADAAAALSQRLSEPANFTLTLRKPEPAIETPPPTAAES